MTNLIRKRFDGYLPVVVDVETSGVDPFKHGLLEIAAIPITMSEDTILVPGESCIMHVLPFEGASLDPAALEVTKIDPFHPFRFAITEDIALERLFQHVATAVKQAQCRRAVLVGHNAHFDLSFIQAAMKRCKITKSPFHAFTCFDTATLSGLIYGKTVLAKALALAKIPFDSQQAHSALYDATQTATLFCQIVNQYTAIRE